MYSIWIPAHITLLLCKKCQYCQKINVNKTYQREKRVLSHTMDSHQLQLLMIWWKYSIFNHKNYNYLDCDCFKKSPFPSNHLFSCYQTVCCRKAVNHIQICGLKQPITFRVIVWFNQSQPWFRLIQLFPFLS